MNTATAPKDRFTRQMALTKAQLGVSTIDDCVRLVTAADSFDELKGTLETFAPKFYGTAQTTAEDIARKRVVFAFNGWAERTGRTARAFISA